MDNKIDESINSILRILEINNISKKKRIQIRDIISNLVDYENSYKDTVINILKKDSDELKTIKNILNN